ncbi:MAG: hypothetical protein QMD05_03720 [Candidatus Brocadiaceae bacterium]|nr:hypothetical protein [Candidatus Brocadiaceae bacterium]
MDRIEQLLEELKKDRCIWETGDRKRIWFTGLAQDVADIFEKYGFGVTKVYLTKREERREADQAKSLQRVIEKFRGYPEIEANRSIGRCIIKALSSLRETEV